MNQNREGCWYPDPNPDGVHAWRRWTGDAWAEPAGVLFPGPPAHALAWAEHVLAAQGGHISQRTEGSFRVLRAQPFLVRVLMRRLLVPSLLEATGHLNTADVSARVHERGTALMLDGPERAWADAVLAASVQPVRG